MGDIAEMILSGILCEQCGVFIDFEEVGYPRLCNNCSYSSHDFEDEEDYLLAKERLETFDPNELIGKEEMMLMHGITQDEVDAVSYEEVEFE